jgi:hypothetical protein
VSVSIGELEGIGSLSSLEIMSVLDIKVLIVNDAVVVFEHLDVDGIGLVDFLRSDVHTVLIGVN